MQYTASAKARYGSGSLRRSIRSAALSLTGCVLLILVSWVKFHVHDFPSRWGGRSPAVPPSPYVKYVSTFPVLEYLQFLSLMHGRLKSECLQF